MRNSQMHRWRNPYQVKITEINEYRKTEESIVSSIIFTSEKGNDKIIQKTYM